MKIRNDMIPTKPMRRSNNILTTKIDHCWLLKNIFNTWHFLICFSQKRLQYLNTSRLCCWQSFFIWVENKGSWLNLQRKRPPIPCELLFSNFSLYKIVWRALLVWRVFLQPILLPSKFQEEIETPVSEYCEDSSWEDIEDSGDDSFGSNILKL